MSQNLLLPFQTKDTIKNAAASVSLLQDEHVTQDIEVQLILWDWAHHSSLEERGPLPLQSPLASPVSLQREETEVELIDVKINYTMILMMRMMHKQCIYIRKD